MALPFQGVGEVAVPPPPGPIGQLMQRIWSCRDISPTKDIMRAVEQLSTLTRAEDAARLGICGELLDRTISYLEASVPDQAALAETIDRLADLPPATADAEYI